MTKPPRGANLGKLCSCTGQQKVKLGKRFKSKSGVINSAKKEGAGPWQFHLTRKGGKSNKQLAIRRADQLIPWQWERGTNYIHFR